MWRQVVMTVTSGLALLAASVASFSWWVTYQNLSRLRYEAENILLRLDQIEREIHAEVASVSARLDQIEIGIGVEVASASERLDQIEGRIDAEVSAALSDNLPTFLTEAKTRFFKEPFEQLTAERISVVDDAGQERMNLGANPERGDRFSLSVFEPNGGLVVMVGGGSIGSGVWLGGVNSADVAPASMTYIKDQGFNIFAFHDDSIPELVVTSRPGGQAWAGFGDGKANARSISIGAFETGYVGLSVFDDQQRPRLSFGQDVSSQIQSVAFDASGNPRAGFGYSSTELGFMEVYHSGRAPAFSVAAANEGYVSQYSNLNPAQRTWGAITNILAARSLLTGR